MKPRHVLLLSLGCPSCVSAVPFFCPPHDDVSAVLFFLPLPTMMCLRFFCSAPPQDDGAPDEDAGHGEMDGAERHAPRHPEVSPTRPRSPLHTLCSVQYRTVPYSVPHSVPHSARHSVPYSVPCSVPYSVPLCCVCMARRVRDLERYVWTVNEGVDERPSSRDSRRTSRGTCAATSSCSPSKRYPPTPVYAILYCTVWFITVVCHFLQPIKGYWRTPVYAVHALGVRWELLSACCGSLLPLSLEPRNSEPTPPLPPRLPACLSLCLCRCSATCWR